MGYAEDYVYGPLPTTGFLMRSMAVKRSSATAFIDIRYQILTYCAKMPVGSVEGYIYGCM
jgi:hypothetical protein